MNYIQFHVGDWEAGTRLLSPTEKGVYIDLLMLYYSLERPLMRTECERMSRAYAQNEKDALEYVLDRFFMEKDGSYHHERCETEIASYRDKSRKAAESAKARWHKRPAESKGGSCRVENVRAECGSDAIAMPTQCERITERNAVGVLTNNQEPVTNNQLIEVEPKAKKKRSSKPKIDDLVKPEGISDEVWRAWFEHKNKVCKSGCTQWAVDDIQEVAKAVGVSVEKAMRVQLANGWQGLNIESLSRCINGTKAQMKANVPLQFDDAYYGDGSF